MKTIETEVFAERPARLRKSGTPQVPTPGRTLFSHL